jgi:hypothetical protein
MVRDEIREDVALLDACCYAACYVRGVDVVREMIEAVAVDWGAVAPVVTVPGVVVVVIIVLG